MTADVITWLTGTLADVEREAQAVGGLALEAYLEGGNDGWAVESDPGGYPSATIGDESFAKFIAANSPAVVLASVEADRAILADHSVEAWPDGLTSCSRCGGPGDCPWPCTTVYLVASRYRHRPGYQAEWEVTS